MHVTHTNSTHAYMHIHKMHAFVHLGDILEGVGGFRKTIQLR